MQLPPAAYWDPVLKRNRPKRMKLFARLLEIGLLWLRPKGTAKYFLGVFFVNKKDKKQKRLILDARIVNRAFVSPRGVSFCSSEGMARIEVCLPNHVEEGNPTWESALESIEFSLGHIQDCIHRCVSDDEFASYFCERNTPHTAHFLAHFSSLFTCTAWLKVLQRVSHKNMFIHMSSCV